MFEPTIPHREPQVVILHDPHAETIKFAVKIFYPTYTWHEVVGTDTLDIALTAARKANEALDDDMPILHWFA